MGMTLEAEMELGELYMLGVGHAGNSRFSQNCCLITKDMETGLQRTRQRGLELVNEGGGAGIPEVKEVVWQHCGFPEVEHAG